jgi:phosphoglucosamine mutase
MPQKLENVKVSSKPPLESLPRYQAALAEAQKQLGGNGRILVRYSGTENKVRVMVEGPENVDAIAKRLGDVLKDEIG